MQTLGSLPGGRGTQEVAGVAMADGSDPDLCSLVAANVDDGAPEGST